MTTSSRPVRRIERDPAAQVDPRAWPATIPAVRQLLDDGLELAPGVTFLVGENGSGKSTLVEAVAEAYGLNPEGGSRGARHRTRETESLLGSALRVVRNPGPLVASYFLRAETMHGLYSYLEDNPARDVRSEPLFHRMSHGESFLALLRTRFAGYGFFVLDEPESALSFRSCLALLALLDDLRREGAQVLCATHSPLLASLPDATVLELGEHGWREVAYADLDVVRDWKAFLAAPDRYLRHLLH
ncbi:MAG: AAA family ATPase [Mycobacteriales bacterium]